MRPPGCSVLWSTTRAEPVVIPIVPLVASVELPLRKVWPRRGPAAHLVPPSTARKRGRTRWKRAGPGGHEELASRPSKALSPPAGCWTQVRDLATGVGLAIRTARALHLPLALVPCQGRRERPRSLPSQGVRLFAWTTERVDRSTIRAGPRPWDRAAPTVRSRSRSRRRRRTPPGLWPGQIGSRPGVRNA